MSLQQICFENDHSATLAHFVKLRTAGASPGERLTREDRRAEYLADTLLKLTSLTAPTWGKFGIRPILRHLLSDRRKLVALS